MAVLQDLTSSPFPNTSSTHLLCKFVLSRFCGSGRFSLYSFFLLMNEFPLLATAALVSNPRSKTSFFRVLLFAPRLPTGLSLFLFPVVSPPNTFHLMRQFLSSPQGCFEGFLPASFSVRSVISSSSSFVDFVKPRCLSLSFLLLSSSFPPWRGDVRSGESRSVRS